MHPVQQFLSVFRWHVPHAIPRYHAATNAEKRSARENYDRIHSQLRDFTSRVTDPDQRRAAIQRGAMRG